MSLYVISCHYRQLSGFCCLLFVLREKSPNNAVSECLYIFNLLYAIICTRVYII